MDAIQIGFDTRLFSFDAIVRAAHRYTNDFFVDLEYADVKVLVNLTPKRYGLSTTGFLEQLQNDVLDEQLREKVRVETSALQATLAQAALLGMIPKFAEGPGK